MSATPTPTVLAANCDPSEAGFDAERLDRIATHLDTYLTSQRLPGYSVAISRNGKRPYVHTSGMRDMEAGLPVEIDTVFRIYSMTKPITTVAAMMLYERGLFDITDPVAKFIPSFGESRVYLRGPSTNPGTVPQQLPMTVKHLMTHTAGLTYGFSHANGIDNLYRQAGYEWGTPKGVDLAAACDTWAAMPLLFQPGTEWNYSVATDVLGRIVEVVSGQSLDVFIAENITGPLGMNETSFWPTDEQADRFAALYAPRAGTKTAFRIDALGKRPDQPPLMLSGGGGLVSTLGDYLRFTEMLQGGGIRDGVRLLGNRTLAFMASNHLPGGALLSEVGRPLFSETNNEGTGFGLGFSVVVDPIATGSPCSKGEFAWGGAASTAFWVDPVEDLSVVFMTQLLPSSTWPVRNELRRLIYSALID